MIDPTKIKNSRTAARAVFTLMAHHTIMPASYKPATSAQFLLQALRTFSDDLPEPYTFDEPVSDVLQKLAQVRGLSPVARFLQLALRRSGLDVTVTVADLMMLGQGGRYRYTKIVGSQDFKRRLDEALTLELTDIHTTMGITAPGISAMVFHLVRRDLYRHFAENAPTLLDDVTALEPYRHATLYFALKSFLMARKDVFDPQLALLGGGATPDVVEAIQHFLQVQGIYRLSDWFERSSHFAGHTFVELTGGRPIQHLSAPQVELSDTDDVSERHALWQRRNQPLTRVR
ncbi:hypothetical protein [Deinococcus yunweiensis]|uniref:hypothetical protein n=1 Tax=Deinococcus yunweiensis TaxID=367282 RepID=UPI00398F36A0